MNPICWSCPDPFLEVLHTCEEASSFQITFESTHQSSPCPYCGVRSFHPHSRYIRLIQDLPIGEKSVFLLLISKNGFVITTILVIKIFLHSVMIGCLRKV